MNFPFDLSTVNQLRYYLTDRFALFLYYSPLHLNPIPIQTSFVFNDYVCRNRLVIRSGRFGVVVPGRPFLLAPPPPPPVERGYGRCALVVESTVRPPRVRQCRHDRKNKIFLRPMAASTTTWAHCVFMGTAKKVSAYTAAAAAAAAGSQRREFRVTERRRRGDR